ncbi:unnamed protein product, partial [Ilex paraguariensis]
DLRHNRSILLQASGVPRFGSTAMAAFSNGACGRSSNRRKNQLPPLGVGFFLAVVADRIIFEFCRLCGHGLGRGSTTAGDCGRLFRNGRG